MRQKIGLALAGFYWAASVLVFADFLLTPPQALANILLLIWTAPLAWLLLWLLGEGFGIGFPFMPEALGYYGSHAAYFIPASLLIGLVLLRLVGGRRS